MNYHVNEYIKNTVRVFPMQNRYGMHRYDMNENPEGQIGRASCRERVYVLV